MICVKNVFSYNSFKITIKIIKSYNKNKKTKISYIKNVSDISIIVFVFHHLKLSVVLVVKQKL